MNAGASPSFGWLGIVRLGLVQTSLGAIVILMTSTLNRVMVVELGLAAAIPGLLVGWHYAVQMSRPRWGYGADAGGRRAPWILGGIAVLAFGAISAAFAASLIPANFWAGFGLSVLAYALIGAGVGAAGTNLLALLAIRTEPSRKAAAAAIVWIMMIMGFVLTAGIGGGFLKPFSFDRLILVTSVVSAIALVVTFLALRGLEPASAHQAAPAPTANDGQAFRAALRETWDDPQARRFTIFVFVSMLAYSAQDLILEPFAGLVHGYDAGSSTQLAGMQNMGTLVGMILTAVAGTVIGKSRAGFMRGWTVGGCIASAAALLALGLWHAGDGHRLAAGGERDCAGCRQRRLCGGRHRLDDDTRERRAETARRHADGRLGRRAGGGLWPWRLHRRRRRGCGPRPDGGACPGFCSRLCG